MRLSFAFLPSLLLAAPAAADTLYVDAAGNTPYTDIQDAIDAAEGGDVILVFPGTYGPVVISGAGITVRSTGGPLLTVIDAGAAGGPAVWFEESVSHQALLHGFTITGGTGLEVEEIAQVAGGGVLARRNSLGRISGNVILGNTAEVGGGVAIVDSAVFLFGNVIVDNEATGAGGGLWVHAPGLGLEVPLACNDLQGNVGGGVGGMYVGDAEIVATNLVFDANVGERGGLWATLQADGSLTNATFVSNESTAASAAGLESESADLAFVNNLVAYNEDGFGVIRSSATATWHYNDVAGNDLGEYAGAAGDPTGTLGNQAVPPTFVYFTPDDGTDDDLALIPGSPLADAGSPTLLDLDSSLSAIGSTGGPHTSCDLDGDGVHDSFGDCRPFEVDFFPGAYELEGGLDHDCDGWGTLSILDFVLDDGGLGGAGAWEFDDPAALPGVGHQGVSAWCTTCGGNAPTGAVADLDVTLDLSSLPAGTEVRLEVTHAYDLGSQVDAAAVQVFDGVDYDDVAAFNGVADEWHVDVVDLSDHAGDMVDVRFHVEPLTTPVRGWAIGRIEVQIVDADGDGRADVLTDCDDADPDVYDGAPELAYDGVDQDCDGADLTDVDGDGVDGELAGGDDCDDTDPAAFPGAEEVPYDGVDQDCDDADLDDLDGDGAAGAEAAGGTDCDDADASIHPDAAEVPYDGVDQDCDGADLVDVDGDGYDGDVEPPFGDCDDTDPAVSPAAVEICGDGLDNDCDGAVDAVPDLDGDGVDLCAGDCDDADPAVAPGLPEACDGLDTDCDGGVPDDEADADADGQRVCAGDCDDADPAVAAAFAEACDGLDNDCDLQIDEDHDDDGDGFSGCTSDCDDQRSTVYPGAPVVCDGELDHDCDGEPDPLQEECLQGCSCAVSAAGSGASSAWLLVGAFALSAAGRRRRRATSR